MIDTSQERHDLAGRAYWDGLWSETDLPEPILDPRATPLGDHTTRVLGEYFHSLFDAHPTDGKRLLEIGAGGSRWLPWFAGAFGFSVTGLDYSERGCILEREVLRRASVAGEVVCADFFSIPDQLQGAFDAVVSFGVAEHFEDTAGCISTFADYLAPGGTVVTVVPNMAGLVGTVQRLLNRDVYDIHHVLGPDDLRRAHEQAGLAVLRSHYLMPTNFGVPNLVGLDAKLRSTAIKRQALQTLVRLSEVGWLAERAGVRLPTTRTLAGYAACVARRP